MPEALPPGEAPLPVKSVKSRAPPRGTFQHTVSRLTASILLTLCSWAYGSDVRAGVLVYAVGDVAECGAAPERSPAARTARLIPADATVLVAGDTTYPTADRATIARCYVPTWGRFRDHTYAVPGNHDYVGGSAADFLQYFGARTPGRTWFRALVGDWWIIGLDSNVAGAELAEQQRWLQEQLDTIAGDRRCLLAMWHHPVVSTGLRRKDGARMRPAWQALDAAKADVVVNGHEHFYESFDPRDGAGHRQRDGIREFIVGTGGAHLYDLSVVRGYHSFARRYGVLELHLEQDHYEYDFRTLDGRTHDAGAAQCRRSREGPLQ
ncbi:MAG: metallophosphoesterase [Sinobacteraceae bacterium]|nr:metallophosphoesterase [Nevskiaceae bacterium]